MKRDIHWVAELILLRQLFFERSSPVFSLVANDQWLTKVHYIFVQYTQPGCAWLVVKPREHKRQKKKLSEWGRASNGATRLVGSVWTGRKKRRRLDVNQRRWRPAPLLCRLREHSRFTLDKYIYRATYSTRAYRRLARTCKCNRRLLPVNRRARSRRLERREKHPRRAATLKFTVMIPTGAWVFLFALWDFRTIGAKKNRTVRNHCCPTPSAS